MLSHIVSTGRNAIHKAFTAGARSALLGGAGRSRRAPMMVDNTAKFKIIDSTLREGEQFNSAFFTESDRRDIARMLSDFGVDYIELTTPAASRQAFKDCEDIAKMGLRSKILTHVRCNMDDVKAAVAAGVDGVNVFCGTSEVLRKHSHGNSIDRIVDKAREVVDYVKAHGKEIRFSTEDSFRSNLDDVIRIYSAVDKMGVDRIGIADTVGIATPSQVQSLVSRIRGEVDCDIEFHAHNDTGCAVANCFTALESGVTHIDTCVLGIGERNGIASLGAFVGRMYTVNPDAVKAKYNLKMIGEIENFVAEKVGVAIPFNNCITGSSAFSHKAGVHIKAVLQNPECYEVLNPADFGVGRNVIVASRLTGWNAIQARSTQLGLQLNVDQVKKVTSLIKNLADTKNLSTADVDAMLRSVASETVSEQVIEVSVSVAHAEMTSRA